MYILLTRLLTPLNLDLSGKILTDLPLAVFIFIFIHHIMVEENTTNKVIQGKKRKETTKLN